MREGGREGQSWWIEREREKDDDEVDEGEAEHVCLVFEVVLKWGNNENTTKIFSSSRGTCVQRASTCSSVPNTEREGVGDIIHYFFVFIFCPNIKNTYSRWY